MFSFIKKRFVDQNIFKSKSRELQKYGKSNKARYSVYRSKSMTNYTIIDINNVHNMINFKLIMCNQRVLISINDEHIMNLFHFQNIKNAVQVEEKICRLDFMDGNYIYVNNCTIPLIMELVKELQNLYNNAVDKIIKCV